MPTHHAKSRSLVVERLLSRRSVTLEILSASEPAPNNMNPMNWLVA